MKVEIIDWETNASGDVCDLAIKREDTLRVIGKDEPDLYRLACDYRELLEECSSLAAGACPVEDGLIGDEYGNFYCTLEREKIDTQFKNLVSLLRSMPEFSDAFEESPKLRKFIEKLTSELRRGQGIRSEG